jgi:hypothetical protein
VIGGLWVRPCLHHLIVEERPIIQTGFYEVPERQNATSRQSHFLATRPA